MINTVYALVFVLALLMPDPAQLIKINRIKTQAQLAFEKGNYKESAKLYRYLNDSLNVHEDAVKFNMATAYYMLGDTAQARNYYQQTAQGSNATLRSKAYLQLGVMDNTAKNSTRALNQFKLALKADAQNEKARYNYEMVKKKLLRDQSNKEEKQQDQKDSQKDSKDKQQKNKNDQQQNQQQDKQDQQQNKQEKSPQQSEKEKQQQGDNQNNKAQQEAQQKQQPGQQNKEKNEPGTDKRDALQQEKKGKQQRDKVPQEVADKLKQMNMSEEKAQMILDAMKNQEVQYLQQNKRKPTQSRDKGKPDW